MGTITVDTSPEEKRSRLKKAAENLIGLSIADSTTRQYHSSLCRYVEFCKNLDLVAYPIHQSNLMLFATELADTMAHSGINVILCGVKFYAQKYGYNSEFSSYKRLYLLLRGIKRSQGKKFKKPLRSPITPDMLNQLKFNLFHSYRSCHDKLMLWSAMLSAFFGFLRISEFTSTRAKSFEVETTLCLSDITTLEGNSFGLQLKASKTDPFRTGVQVRLAGNDSPLCPTHALRSYLQYRGGNEGPLFIFENGHYLTRQSFTRVIQELLPGIKNISTHSFRIGAATTAAALGFPRWLIKSLGRWESDCFRLYIRVPMDTIKKVSSSITQQTGSLMVFDPDLFTKIEDYRS